MWGYWGTGWGYAYSPGYVQQDQVVSVESNVYSLTQGKLVWASRTKTYNPESVRKLVNDIVDATVSQMKKEKVFASSTLQDAPVDVAVGSGRSRARWHSGPVAPRQQPPSISRTGPLPSGCTSILR